MIIDNILSLHQYSVKKFFNKWGHLPRVQSPWLQRFRSSSLALSIQHPYIIRLYTVYWVQTSVFTLLQRPNE